MRQVVIVQARMGSSRLPGKVLRTLAGKTVLSRVLERCRAIPGIDAVCCATSTLDHDDEVARQAALEGAEVFRGSEDDVLSRYAGAARATGADVVMRVTADCPLIDPQVCGGVLTLRAAQDLDYACNNLPPSFPHGLDCEAVRISWLLRAEEEATSREQREHVTPYIRTHPDVNKANLPCERDGVASLRWTLDTQEDWNFLERLVALLPEGPDAWRWRVPLAIVEADPTMRHLSPDRAVPNA